ncbi:hypothetical protein BXZ70DRAFT_1004874 [Cristinia sonorae]|uniref:Uncharacterized protein n=1 Tax=Cristinia sonorae TaxID=1940300 RepID=A0A8K0UXK4_9AGAR|nr:hypothetical protein BXZ70DRAFT_1004874 [Cristinia sonorae]
MSTMLQNTTVSHLSPMVSYIPGILWFEGTSSDPELYSYPSQSYHATNSTNGHAGVSFQWTGAGEVWVFGAYRERLGAYQVVLDGAITEFPGFKPYDTEDYEAVLFNAPILPGPHQIELVNTGNNSVLDITSIVFQSAQGAKTTIDDTDSRCKWAGGWQTDATTHTTFASEGRMWMNFSPTYLWAPLTAGVGIEVWGPTGPSNSPYSITVDGWTAPSFTSNTRIPAKSNASQLLFFSYGLDDRDHSLLIRNDPAWSGDTAAATTFGIDYTVVFAAVDPIPPPKSKKNIAIIVASSVSGGVLLLLICVTCFWCRRRISHIKKRESLLRPSPFGLIVIPASPTTPDSPYRDQDTHGLSHKSPEYLSDNANADRRGVRASIINAFPRLKMAKAKTKSKAKAKMGHRRGSASTSGSGSEKGGSPSSSAEFMSKPQPLKYKLDLDRRRASGDAGGGGGGGGGGEVDDKTDTMTIGIEDTSAGSLFVNAPSSPHLPSLPPAHASPTHIASMTILGERKSRLSVSRKPSLSYQSVLDSPIDPSLQPTRHSRQLSLSHRRSESCLSETRTASALSTSLNNMPLLSYPASSGAPTPRNPDTVMVSSPPHLNLTPNQNRAEVPRPTDPEITAATHPHPHPHPLPPAPIPSQQLSHPHPPAPDPHRRVRPLPVPQPIRVGIPVPRGKDGARTPGTTTSTGSQPPPYQPYQFNIA